MWYCEKCNEEFERLQIAWGISGGEKVDILDFFCSKCGNTGYREEPKLIFNGTKAEEELYWNAEWNGEFATETD